MASLIWAECHLFLDYRRQNYENPIYLDRALPSEKSEKNQSYLGGPARIRWHLGWQRLWEKAKMQFYLGADAILSGR